MIETLTFNQMCAFAGFALAIGVCLAMAIVWEKSRPSLEAVLSCAVLCAIAVAGRVFFAVIPNVQPVTALCILAGCLLGRRAGFIVGASSALVSNCFLGQGIWSPWQMFAWGLVGYLAGVLFAGRDVKAMPIMIYGFVASYLFGLIMNTWMIFAFTPQINLAGACAIYAGSLFFDTAHACSTVAFLAVLYVPFRSKFERLSRKFKLFAQ